MTEEFKEKVGDHVSRLGDFLTKGGLGAVMGVIFMAVQDFRDDQDKIMAAINELDKKFVASDGQMEALRAKSDSLIAEIMENRKLIGQQWARSRRNDEALKMLARILSELTKKEITIPPVENF